MLALVLSGAAPAAAGGDAGTEAWARESPELVVLVHGMGRTKLSMLPLVWALEREGYEVLNWGYSSFCCSVAELAGRLDAELDARPDLEERRVHFVGHSLGNIIVSTLLATDPPERVGRIVMLAPPNQGSRAADRFAGLAGWLMPPLLELTTEARGGATVPPALRELQVGVIAGAHDAKVSVEESHLAGESGHVVVPAAHTFLMAREDVRRLTLTFLREGRFGAEAVPAHAAAGPH